MARDIQTRTQGANHAWRSPVYQVPLITGEAAFLVIGLSDISRIAEALTHHPPVGASVSPWYRRQVVDKVGATVAALRYHDDLLLVVGALGMAIVRQGIEGNPYFVRMADGDPRLNAASIRRADALRLKLNQILPITIGPVPLGRPRV